MQWKMKGWYRDTHDDIEEVTTIEVVA
jgi:hypothetical protein